MKYISRLLLSLFVKIVSVVYSYPLSMRYNTYKNIIYTEWIRHFMGKVGSGCRFYYPLRLQGGGNRRISIGDRTYIHAFSIIGCWEKHGNSANYSPEIIIGDDCSIGEFCHITAIKKVTIGNGLLTGRFVYIGDNSHGGLSWEEACISPLKRELKSKGEIKIGNNVWIGDKATILGGVTIGDNVIIAANTVVNKSIPANSIVAGVPGKIVKCLQ